MSSWLLCDCGERILKNLFSGAKIRLAIDEEFLDRDFAGVTAEALVSELVVRAELLLTCEQCGRVHLVDETGGRPTRSFAPIA